MVVYKLGDQSLDFKLSVGKFILLCFVTSDVASHSPESIDVRSLTHRHKLNFIGYLKKS